MTTLQVTPESLIARWSDPTARPLFKGSLIDETGCCCAQGDALRCAGWTDEQLRNTRQSKADKEVAVLLGISRTHAVLLRRVNDSKDGCPQKVLTLTDEGIGSILGSEWRRVLKFGKYIDTLDAEGWRKVVAAWDAAWDAAGAVAWDAAVDAARVAAVAAARVAAVDAAGDAAWDAAGAVAWAAARDAARDAAGAAAWDAAWDAAPDAAPDAARVAAVAAARDAAVDAAGAAARACSEIQGHSKLEKLFFLPMFGFNTIADIDALPE